MTDTEKLAMVKTLLGITGTDEDTRLGVFLTSAENEILGWRYSYADETPEDVPTEYEMTQVNAVVAGYTHSGAEGQTTHNENGINRTFSYVDMQDYIRHNVIPIAKVM